MFSLLFLITKALYLENRIDATLASLGILHYLRLRTIGPPKQTLK